MLFDSPLELMNVGILLLHLLHIYVDANKKSEKKNTSKKMHESCISKGIAHTSNIFLCPSALVLSYSNPTKEKKKPTD